MNHTLVEQLGVALQESLGARTQLQSTPAGEAIRLRDVDYRSIMPAAAAFFRDTGYAVREASPFFFVATSPAGDQYWITRHSRTVSVRDSLIPEIDAERRARDFKCRF